MVLPMFFRGQGDQALSVTWSEIASGTGYITFYCGKSSTPGYLMSNNTFYSDDIDFISTAGNDAAYTQEVDYDFDAPVNKTITIGGSALVTMSYAVTETAGTGYIKGRFRVRHWDGTTETNLVTSDYGTECVTGGTTICTTTMAATIPNTRFAKGDTIRLTIEMWRKNDPGGAGNDTGIKLGHDPMNRNGTGDWGSTGTYPMTLTFQCPVQLIT